MHLQDPAEKIIIALDVESVSEANEIINDLKGTGVVYKIGLQLFTSAGPDLVRQIIDKGEKVFLDLKFHDIPNTVAKASAEAAKLGVWMFNVHALGGSEMMKAAAEEVGNVCESKGLSKPHMIAVTILTSSTSRTLKETGIDDEVENEVLRLARLAADCGLDGVVASSHEIETLRKMAGEDDFLIVTPGIRPGSATNDDQKRVMTPEEALSAGADHLVIGRPVTKAKDRRMALTEILRNIGSDS